MSNDKGMPKPKCGMGPWSLVNSPLIQTRISSLRRAVARLLIEHGKRAGIDGPGIFV